MKKERNCGVPYPVYPTPMMMPNQAMPMYPTQNQPYLPNQGTNPGMNQPVTNIPSNSIESQLNTLMTNMNTLERRVTALESIVGTTTYNNTNYQMM